MSIPLLMSTCFRTCLVLILSLPLAAQGPFVVLSGGCTNRFGMVFAPIPPGSFSMGSADREPQEKPVHTVRISKGFAMQTTHVTVKQWKSFAEATGYLTDSEQAGKAWVWTDEWTEQKGISWRNPGFSQTDDHPVLCISWNDAQAFLKWLNREDPGKGYRLPTESEWEYACKAGTEGQRYAEDINSIAWYLDNSGRQSHPVGQKAPNAWGLYDMLGNAGQWCQDFYGPYPKNSVKDPKGPSDGLFRVNRGSSWLDPAPSVRCARRIQAPANRRLRHLGFRVVRTLP